MSSRNSGIIATCAGNDHRPEQRPEDSLAAVETQLGESVARHRVEQQREQRGTRGQEQAVQEVAAHPVAREQLAIVGERRLLRQQRRRERARLPGGMNETESIHSNGNSVSAAAATSSR